MWRIGMTLQELHVVVGGGPLSKRYSERSLRQGGVSKKHAGLFYSVVFQTVAYLLKIKAADCTYSCGFMSFLIKALKHSADNLQLSGIDPSVYISMFALEVYGLFPALYPAQKTHAVCSCHGMVERS